MSKKHVSTQAKVPSLPPMSRRTLLTAGLAAAVIGAVGGAAFPVRATAVSAGTVLPLVAEIPGAPDRTLFTASEQVMARYLMIVAPMANDIVDDDSATFGYMSGGWWRTPSQPFNARVQEHVATLSWFYANDRPWNPYFGDAALLGRLDAALQHYLGLQHPNGSFPEYSATEFSRAATAFGMVALADVLENLRAADVLPQRQAELESALRNAASWFMDLSNGEWKTPLPFVNQIVGGLAGVARAAQVIGDAQLAAALDDRLDFVAAQGQAPAGFFHEPFGFDFGYNFSVMLPDLADLYQRTGSQVVLDMAQKWASFMGYASVREPDGAGYITYSAASARTADVHALPNVPDDADRNALAAVFAEDAPELAAFLTTGDQKAALRAAWAASGDPLVARAKQDTSPRLWMHVLDRPALPTAAGKDAAEAALPYRASERFTERRVGTLLQDYVFTRRPSYYLASFYGTRSETMNRMGPGLLWHPQMGAVIAATNTAVGAHAWGFIDSSGVESAMSDLPVTYRRGLDGDAVPAGDLSAETGTLTFDATSAPTGVRSLTTLWDDGITVRTEAAAPGTYSIPLLLQQTDVVTFSTGGTVSFNAPSTAQATGITVVRGGARMHIDWGASAVAQVTASTSAFLASTRRLHVLSVPVAASSQVDIVFAEESALAAREIRVSASAAVEGRDVSVRVTNLEEVPVDVQLFAGLAHRTLKQVKAGETRIERLRSASSWGAASGVQLTAQLLKSWRLRFLHMTVPVK